ncbi:MAG: hypothetical protein RRA94_13095, partial [Bacteroidota bacterium]|nr:hypothetical protein [Bacteroidota bacterium]
RGRQMAHQELGLQLIQKLKAALEDIAIVEKDPNMEGRSMIAIFAPDKKKIADLEKALVEGDAQEEDQ